MYYIVRNAVVNLLHNTCSTTKPGRCRDTAGKREVARVMISHRVAVIVLLISAMVLFRIVPLRSVYTAVDWPVYRYSCWSGRCSQTGPSRPHQRCE